MKRYEVIVEYGPDRERKAIVESASPDRALVDAMLPADYVINPQPEQEEPSLRRSPHTLIH